jgi:hypothetical protein
MLQQSDGRDLIAVLLQDLGRTLSLCLVLRLLLLMCSLFLLQDLGRSLSSLSKET